MTTQVVIIDNGSGVIKAGLGGAEYPTCIVPNIVGTPKFKKCIPSSAEDSYIGQSVEKHRGLLKLSYPMEHGIVENWKDMEKIWKQVYSELRILSQDHPVLLTESPFVSNTQREKAAEILFETIRVPSLMFAVQAVLSLYASGTTTGVVLDSGDGVTHAVPVYEGYAVTPGVVRSDVAGRDVTQYLQQLLRRSGNVLHTSAEFEIVRSMKEQLCSATPTKFSQFDNIEPAEFKMPDGNVIRVGGERHQAPELLFNTSLMGYEYNSVPGVLNTSILKCDVDLRRVLYSSIYLAGGTTLLKGFPDRLVQELRSVVPKDMKVKITAPPERKYTTWVGGSILTSVAMFRSMLVTYEQYQQEGPRALHAKSFL